jgi:hypothetical protein
MPNFFFLCRMNHLITKEGKEILVNENKGRKLTPSALAKIFNSSKMNWANEMNKNSAKKRATRRAARRAAGLASRSASPVRSGDTKKVGNITKIYTTQPTTLANGKTVHGHWVTAVDPEGDYGGPYANVEDLLRNPRFRSNAADLEKIKRNYVTRKGRSRSRSGSRRRK